ncbi:MAG: hypothetical protein A3B23_03985 [Candidatus Colwellbacteria bacterium RIFCSPLOWO2_01_FULL_48_10]|nr:MAG: hypothetical protein A3B23_03985 [Candidatus Colwellbacteria bacterium RIFCSPLOWO2_01_FULL_48_10]
MNINSKGRALNKQSALKGFTLIEMLVVVAIISILSGLTLTGIGGFTARARDTRRIGDLKNVQNYLEFYFTKCGIYPGTSACAIGSLANWSELSASLAGLGAKVPNDPISTRNYFYGVTTGNNLTYIIGAKLETENKILGDSNEIDSTTGFTMTTGADCSDTAPAYGYCIGS